MPSYILGFSGKIGSGKTTLSRATASHLEWAWVSFGDYLRFVASEQGLAGTREELQAMGADLVSVDIEGFCHAVLAQCQWVPGMPIVIDGIRHKEVVAQLQQIVEPARLLLVHVTADTQMHNDRLIARGDQKGHHASMTAPTEEQSITTLPFVADLLIDNYGDIGATAEEIARWVKDKSTSI